MVAFLFTDIEGSTHRWECHRDAMDAAVARHDALLRAAIERHRGRVFKTVGDAFCAAFAQVPDAVAAAVDAQRALAAEDFSAVEGLRVRMAVHIGEASQRDDDYFGPTLNRVARLMSAGHGGQVLLSDAARQNLPDEQPVCYALVDFGLRRLKDLTQPERVWQLTAAGLTAEFPPLNSLDARPNNLPVEVTALIGREHDLADLRQLVASNRLVTLSGAGGIGKTRVAVQVGADLIDRYPDGVWFADLAPLSNGELVASVVARVLGVQQPQEGRVDDVLPGWLKAKHLLLILDNCEHVIEAAATLANAILRESPGVHILATSRQALGIGGENVHRLPSLALAEPEDVGSAEQALNFGAIALFAERAAASNTRFALTDENAPIVADICKRLDGIPLAIELAAARTKILSLDNLAQHLGERFALLTGGVRTALPRQKTLSATIDWSYNLLSEQEQAIFRRLGIFAGGFSLEAVTAVCSSGQPPDVLLFDLLGSLVDKSLVVAETGGRHERYGLLESMRAYALQKLHGCDEREQLAARHGQHFTALAAATDRASGNMSVAAVLELLEPEVDNFRAALEWSLRTERDVALGGALAGALERLWFQGGLTAEGRWWIRTALERLGGENAAISARLWRALALLTSGKGKYDSAQRASALYAQESDEHGQAHALRLLARGLIQMGRLEDASDISRRALEAFRTFGDRRGQALCLNELGDIAGDRRDFEAARRLYAESLEMFRGLEDEAGDVIVLGNLAELEFEAGHPEQALLYGSQALQIDSRGKNATSLASNHANMAAYSIAVDELSDAKSHAREGLRWAQKAQTGQKVAWTVQHLALLAALQGDREQAARLLGWVNLKYEQAGLKREPTERWGFNKLSELLAEHFAQADIAALCAEGAGWPEARAVEHALSV